MGRRAGRMAARFVVGAGVAVVLSIDTASPAPPRDRPTAAPLGALSTPTPTTTNPEESVGASPADATMTAVRLTPPPPQPPLGSEFCPTEGHAAVVDRDAQRGWLCADGLANAMFPITTAFDQPHPGQYSVYAKDRLTTSTFGGHFSYLDHFVAFTRGIHTGARIAFHAVPRTAGGTPYQPFDAVGTQEWRGESAGCIRVLPDQAAAIWNHLAVGDPVIVIS